MLTGRAERHRAGPQATQIRPRHMRRRAAPRHVANATGRSSIYGGNLPTTPWTVDADGRGPACRTRCSRTTPSSGSGYGPPPRHLVAPSEGRLPRAWIALLRGRVRASLAATGGVESSADVARFLLSGADVVMTASALLRHGPPYAAELVDGLLTWMQRQGLHRAGRAARHAGRARRHRRVRVRARRATSPHCTRRTPAPTSRNAVAPGRRWLLHVRQVVLSPACRESTTEASPGTLPSRSRRARSAQARPAR